MNKILYCNNCGKQGHISNDCKIPITSVGIVLFKYQNNEPSYLLVRRKETFGFSDFIRGKYPIFNKIYLQNLVDEMTMDEKELIKTQLNEINELGKDPSETILKKYFSHFKNNEDNGINLNLMEIINNSKTRWNEPEWGFPKGRRNYQEKDLDCALREFEEETGYNRSEITLIENLIPLEEIFTGSNYKIYKHRYYLAKLNDDSNVKLNTFQESEISKMEWAEKNKCLELVRPYNVEKKSIINIVHNLVTNNLFYLGQ